MAKNGLKMQKTGHKNEFLAIFPFFMTAPAGRGYSWARRLFCSCRGRPGLRTRRSSFWGCRRGIGRVVGASGRGLDGSKIENLAQKEARSAPEPKNRIFFR